MSKTIAGIYSNPQGHWVGDGFPVRSLFSYGKLGAQISPFLLFDYAGPYHFEPTTQRRGVGQHPHRGFETVSIVYDGEVEHVDSDGHGGVIGPGDVQWMTAARGIIHEEYHAPSYAKTGGPFRMVQLWVNLPAKDKMAPSGYQAILSADIPQVQLPNKAGIARIIAGDFGKTLGPARTFTPINIWDLHLAANADLTLDLPEGHNSMLVMLTGTGTIGDTQPLVEAEMALLSHEGQQIRLRTDGPVNMLILTGEPIDEPIAGYGPFVMNSQAEIRQAVEDYNAGQFLQS